MCEKNQMSMKIFTVCTLHGRGCMTCGEKQEMSLFTSGCCFS